MKEYESNIINAIELSNLEFVISVPTSGIDNVYKYFESKERCIYSTREDEAMAISAGLSISKNKSVLIIQQSGVGNLLNTMFTLIESYDFYFPVIVYDRGSDDINPIHWISSNNTNKVISSLYNSVKIDFNNEKSIQQFHEGIRNKIIWFFAQTNC